MFLRRPTEQYHVVLSGPGLARGDDRRYALSVLDAILGGSASSRLFQEIREKRGMAYSVYSYTSQYAETGQVGIYVGTREDNLGECVDVIVRELGELAAGRLRDGELERAKESLEGRLLLAQESTSNRMTRLGKSLIAGLELHEPRPDDPPHQGGRRGRRRRACDPSSSTRRASRPLRSGRARRNSRAPAPGWAR